jgi:hypothetical protein
MAYKHKALSKTFPYPVKFTRLEEDGNQSTHVIKFDFFRKKRSEMDELMNSKPAEVKESSETSDGKRFYNEMLDKDVAFIQSIAAGWHDVEINGSTEWNEDNLRVLLDDSPGLSQAIFSAFAEGNAGGIRKN